MKIFDIFRRKKKKTQKAEQESSEEKLDKIIDLIKDLERRDYNSLREGMDLVYNGYQKIRNAKTKNEKEFTEIDKAEKYLEVEK